MVLGKGLSTQWDVTVEALPPIKLYPSHPLGQGVNPWSIQKSNPPLTGLLPYFLWVGKSPKSARLPTRLITLFPILISVSLLGSKESLFVLLYPLLLQLLKPIFIIKVIETVVCLFVFFVSPHKEMV